MLINSVRSHGKGRNPDDVDATAHEIVAAASLHRVTPAVAGHLAGVAGHCEPTGPLARARHAQLIRHLAAKSDLGTIGQALDRLGTAWATVKGPTLADRVWPRPDMREYYDLDIVVDRRAFGEALAALEAVGCTLVDRNWPMLRSTMRAEIAMRGPLGTPVDLHWDIAVTKDLRRDFATDVDGMLARAVQVELAGGTRTRTLDPVDTVFHLAFHAAQAGANRLMWLGDVWFASGVPGVDGVELAQRAGAAGASVPVSLVLRRTEEVLGPLGGVLEPLRRASEGAWGHLVRSRDRRSRFPGLPGDPHLGGTLYAAARSGVGPSVAATARIKRTVWRDERRHARHGSGSHPLRVDVPDALARRGYLHEVQNGSSRAPRYQMPRSAVGHLSRGWAD